MRTADTRFFAYSSKVPKFNRSKIQTTKFVVNCTCKAFMIIIIIIVIIKIFIFGHD